MRPACFNWEAEPFFLVWEWRITDLYVIFVRNYQFRIAEIGLSTIAICVSGIRCEWKTSLPEGLLYMSFKNMSNNDMDPI